MLKKNLQHTEAPQHISAHYRLFPERMLDKPRLPAIFVAIIHIIANTSPETGEL